MKNEIKNLDDLFNKVELYNEVKIKLFDNDGENYKLLITVTLFAKGIYRYIY